MVAVPTKAVTGLKVITPVVALTVQAPWPAMVTDFLKALSAGSRSTTEVASKPSTAESLGSGLTVMLTFCGGSMLSLVAVGAAGVAMVTA